MLQHLRIILIYTLAISIVVLGVRPLIASYLSLPVVAVWTINAEEEEENKKDTNEEENEKKIVSQPVSLVFFYFFKKTSIVNIQHINNIHLPFPTPPPRS